MGYSLLIKKENIISLEPDRVMIGNGPSFGCVLMKDFLEVLAKKIKKNTTSFDNYSRMYVPVSVPPKQKPGEPLKAVNLFKHIQVSLIFPSSFDHIMHDWHFQSSNDEPLRWTNFQYVFIIRDCDFGKSCLLLTQIDFFSAGNVNKRFCSHS